jgi:hydrogenase maturation factor HypE
MKKLVLFATIGLFLIGMTACGGGGKYADAKEAMQDMVDLMDNLAADMEKADDAKSVAAVLNKYGDKLQALKPRMEEIEKKYPELKDLKPEELPEELKGMKEKVEAAAAKMMGAMGKVMKYASDPEVMKAAEKIK